ncbi:MAG: 4-hydroxy-2-oxoheptanedioate aldolase [Vicinamibacterales bacterium]
MELPINTFKRALKAGHLQIGVWSSLASNISAEVVGGAGFDWLVIDAEHGPNDVPAVLGQLQAIAAGPTHPVVRPVWNDTVLIKRFLDIGVQTLLVPYVQTADEARQAVAATRYPPRGVRGFAVATRASRFGRVKDYHTRAEEEICVLVQVETREALGNLEEIAAVEGVDGVFIGPGDLSADLGYLGQQGHPEVRAIIEDAIARITACGSIAGILTGDETLARRYIELGCLFTAVGSDMGILARGAEQLAARFKAPTKP